MTETDVYRRQQFGGTLGFGQWPALLIVDFVNGFADPEMSRDLFVESGVGIGVLFRELFGRGHEYIRRERGGAERFDVNPGPGIERFEEPFGEGERFVREDRGRALR